MSDLVKTGNEIIHDAWEPREVNEQNKILNIKYLVLPFGLDTIQTMLLYLIRMNNLGREILMLVRRD